MKRGGYDEMSDDQVHKHIKSIFNKLEVGEVKQANGARVKIKGDVSQLSSIIGLTTQEKALISNFQFMSGNLAGTRQIRRHIGHSIKTSMIVYGCPVFMTITPATRSLLPMQT